MAVTVNGVGPVVVSAVQESGQIGVSVSGGIGPSVIVNGTATSIVGTAGVNPFIAGPNITITTTGGGITIFGRDVPVASVQGRTGNVVLTLADVTAAAASHSHSTTDITGFTAAAAAAAPVQKVANRTGNVTISTTDVSGLSETFGKVFSVQGRTGTVTLSVADITAAAASHTHDYAASSHSHNYVTSLNGGTGTLTISAGNNVTIQTAGGDIEISAGSSLQIGTVSSSNTPTATISGDPPALDVTFPSQLAIGVVGTATTAAATISGDPPLLDILFPPALTVGSVANGTATTGIVEISGDPPALNVTFPLAGVSWSPVPPGPDYAGTSGSLARDSSYLYVAVGQNTWKRASLSSWTPTDSLYSNVQLLLHFNQSLTDSSSFARSVSAIGPNVLYTTGIDKLFGSGSGTVNWSESDPGAGYYSVPASSAWDLGTSDFSVELFFRPFSGSSDPASRTMILGTDGWGVFLDPNRSEIGGNTGIRFLAFDSGGGIVRSTLAVPVAFGSWHYIHVRRSGSLFNTRVAVLGSNTVSDEASSASGSNISSYGSALTIGGNSSRALGWSLFDEVRITTGVARALGPAPDYPFADQ